MKRQIKIRVSHIQESGNEILDSDITVHVSQSGKTFAVTGKCFEPLENDEQQSELYIHDFNEVCENMGMEISEVIYQVAEKQV